LTKILVTGGAGFIGSYLVDRLIARGDQVVVLDNLSSGFLENLNSTAYFLKGDVRSPDEVRFAATAMIGKVDIIFHLAEYIPNIEGHVIKSSINSPRADMDVSVGGTINVLETARDIKAHVVLTSTVAVYGTYSEPIREDFPTLPLSPYGVNKFSAEEYCRLYSRIHGVKVTIFRLFNNYGTRQKKYVMYDVIQKLLKDPIHLRLMGDGTEIRDYTYIDDLLSQILTTVDNQTGLYLLQNTGTGRGTQTSEIVGIICDKMRVNPEIIYDGKWIGNAQRIVSARHPEEYTDVREGIKHLVQKLVHGA